MAWFRNTAETKDKTPSVRDLSEESRADVEAALEDGSLPSDVSREFGLPLTVVQAIRRGQIRNRTEKEKATAEASSSTEPKQKREASVQEQINLMLMQQIQTQQLSAQLDKIKADAVFEKEKRDLELERMRLELKQKRLEMEAEYEDDEDDEPEGLDPGAFIGPDGPNIWAFLTELMKKPPRSAAPTVGPTPEQQTGPSVQQHLPTPTGEDLPDVSKPLTDEQIEKYLVARATPEDRAKIKALPKTMLRKALQQRFPGITAENIERIIQKVKGDDL